MAGIHDTWHSNSYDNSEELPISVTRSSVERRPSLDSLCACESSSFDSTSSQAEKPHIKPPGPGVWRVRPFTNWWLWEIICIIFAVLCIIAVGILASRLNGTQVSNWTFVLQPSTLISALIMAAQSSMMLVVAEAIGQLKWLHMSLPEAKPLSDLHALESASRGPLGSLNIFYLWKPQTKAICSLVYMASLVTIAALAMGPFSQQIVSIQLENLKEQGNAVAMTAASNSYYTNQLSDMQWFANANGELGMNIGLTTTANWCNVNSAMQGGFYNGMYGLGGSLFDFGCPSGNCTWERFTSLGFCSTCVDVSASTNITRSPNTGGLDEFQTPGGPRITINQYERVATNLSYPSGTLEAITAHLLSLVVAQRNEDKITSYWSNYTVTECSIDWCAKQYSNITVVRSSTGLQFVLCILLSLLVYRRTEYYKITIQSRSCRSGR